VPQPVFTSVSAGAGPGANAGHDVVTVPFPAALPHAARVVAGAGGGMHLELDLFGTHEAATWITHASSLRVVREVTVAQQGPGHVRVRVELKEPKRLWGWRLDSDARALRLLLRHPPVLAAAPASPLSGLVVAVEAGHGSPANLGAVGATGVPEKDINLWTSEALQRELEAAGARVVMIRVGDENPNLRERAERTLAAGAHLFVSVHANAADTANGYLRAGGTSTYYKHAHGREAAAAIQQRMLAATGLPDFGLVGAFNYTPIRLLTSMPAVLVEQAFVSNPAEEALMLEPAFRERMARAVREGLEDFLRREFVR
jgi:N-acetylmuramoyl-L-alanine amidase